MHGIPESGYTFLSSFKDAYSSFDERHRLTINGIIDFPFGFQVADILNLGSPTPILMQPDFLVVFISTDCKLEILCRQEK